ncbi:hypothetical protein IG9_05723 [Bacillus cereus HuA2-9]|nr:hypothetical protein IG9_05723 [Bacillus cereus HuA2-9]
MVMSVVLDIDMIEIVIVMSVVLDVDMIEIVIVMNVEIGKFLGTSILKKSTRFLFL